MKKLLLLLTAVLITISLSARHFNHRLTAEDKEVFETLMYLRSQGDIILPEIHVYASQDTTKKMMKSDTTKCITQCPKDTHNKEMKQHKEMNHGEKSTNSSVPIKK
jgi:hypothetical protein